MMLKNVARYQIYGASFRNEDIVKFGHSEEHTKFEKNSSLKFDVRGHTYFNYVSTFLPIIGQISTFVCNFTTYVNQLIFRPLVSIFLTN